MFAFKIIASELKNFMNLLLREDTFDQFEARDVEVVNFTKFLISGIEEEISEGEEDGQRRKICSWSVLRPYIFHIIKGEKRPKLIKIAFSPPPSSWASIHPNGSAFFLNMQYNGEEVLFTTAVSEKSFSLDKQVEAAWEEYVKEFFRSKHIVISTQL